VKTWVAIAVSASLGLMLCAPAAAAVMAPLSAPSSLSVAGLSGLAQRDIPAADVGILHEAAASCPGLSWAVLAGIAKVETDFGRSNLPGVRSGANPAGAMGPFQFLAATWARYGAGDVYDFHDAALGAARYLCALGAGSPAGLAQAVFGYNHAWWYVAQVLGWAAAYLAEGTAGLWQGLSGALEGPVGAVRVVAGRIEALFPPVPPGGFPDLFPWGQCTYFAAYQHLVTWNGNAADWWANARAAGAAEIGPPSVGAIAVYGAGKGFSVFGHVAIVVASNDQSFTVEEMNFVGLGVIDQRVDSVANPDLLGFIA
jgi:CHAP domain